MATKYIHFRGIDAVIKAYQFRSVDTWAVFQDKMLMAKGDNEIELRKFLEMLTEGSCPYTLKIYENIEPDHVKDNTGSDGGFNFKLVDEDEDYGPYTLGNKKNRLLERVARLEQEKGIAEVGEFDDELPETLEEAAIGMLKRPWEAAELINTIKGIFNIQPGYVPPRPFNNTTMGNTGATMKGTQTQQSAVDRLENAVNVLEKFDPKIIDHLEKLAMIAQSNPAQFNFLIQALENMR